MLLLLCNYALLVILRIIFEAINIIYLIAKTFQLWPLKGIKILFCLVISFSLKVPFTILMSSLGALNIEVIQTQVSLQMKQQNKKNMTNMLLIIHNTETKSPFKPFFGVFCSIYQAFIQKHCNLFIAKCLVPTGLTGGYGVSVGQKCANFYEAHKWSTLNVKVVDHYVILRSQNVHAHFLNYKQQVVANTLKRHKGKVRVKQVKHRRVVHIFLFFFYPPKILQTGQGVHMLTRLWWDTCLQPDY